MVNTIPRLTNRNIVGTFVNRVQNLACSATLSTVEPRTLYQLRKF
jgi:hypothetical protein